MPERLRLRAVDRRDEPVRPQRKERHRRAADRCLAGQPHGHPRPQGLAVVGGLVHHVNGRKGEIYQRYYKGMEDQTDLRRAAQAIPNRAAAQPPAGSSAR
ncbi:hypothetical protein GCM10023191_098270 [Actinoallomurus oryzae]|uniref:Tn3 transposase DDE domain-containing protein n=1 Tax=Actinoallomurus oryzae TaxID=502180 RepID=A0ABP8R8B9_9ACTN